MKGKRKVFSQLPFVFLGKKFLLSLRKKYSSSSAKPRFPSVLNSSPLIPSSLDFYSSTHSFSHSADQPSTHSSLLHLFIHPPILSSIFLFIHPSIYPSCYPFIYPSIPLPSTHPSILPSFIHLCIYPAIHPSGQQATDSEPHPFLGLQGPQGQVR